MNRSPLSSRRGNQCLVLALSGVFVIHVRASRWHSELFVRTFTPSGKKVTFVNCHSPQPGPGGTCVIVSREMLSRT